MPVLGTEVGYDKVRSLFGLGPDELEDSTIESRAVRVDIALKRNVPDYATIIANKLTDTDAYELLVDYVAHAAALFLVPSIKLFLEQKTRDDSGAEGSRFNLTDESLNRMVQDWQAHLSDLTAELATETPAEVSYSTMSVATPTFDVVTGLEQ